MKKRNVMVVCAAFLLIAILAGSALAEWNPSPLVMEGVKVTRWEWSPHIVNGSAVAMTSGVILPATPYTTRPVGINDGTTKLPITIYRSQLTGVFGARYEGETIAIRGN